jgi:hypothetical protein
VFETRVRDTNAPVKLRTKISGISSTGMIKIGRAMMRRIPRPQIADATMPANPRFVG